MKSKLFAAFAALVMLFSFVSCDEETTSGTAANQMSDTSVVEEDYTTDKEELQDIPELELAEEAATSDEITAEEKESAESAAIADNETVESTEVNEEATSADEASEYVKEASAEKIETITDDTEAVAEEVTEAVITKVVAEEVTETVKTEAVTESNEKSDTAVKTVIEETTAPYIPETAANTVIATASNCDYVLNTNSKKFHYPNCSSVKSMAAHNTKYFIGTRAEVISQGYDSCGRCKP